MTKVDVAIVGGGLAGMLAALRLCRAGKNVVVIDHSIEASQGALGGFACFSGAKFSLPPAGLGLLPVVGDIGRLNTKIREVLRVLRLDERSVLASVEHGSDGEIAIGPNTLLRKYDSIVLTPDEISALISRLTAELEKECRIVRGLARSLEIDGSEWRVTVERGEEEEQFRADAVFFAGGRLASDILIAAGAKPSPGKGLDVGVRFEFEDREAVRNLRELGADAKIISSNCRTFCLNSPGKIYRYRVGPITIPGGVVADDSVKTANFGVLFRAEDKPGMLRRVTDGAVKHWAEMIASSDEVYKSAPFGALAKRLTAIWGDAITRQLEEFCLSLQKLGLVDWSQEYKVHSPLIDWHWNTFSLPSSHMTSLQNVYALGDVSGHARGLLQASLSGWIAAEEYLSVNAN